MIQFQVEGNVARLEHIVDTCRIVVTVEHQHADAITKEEAEIALTKVMPLFPQRVRYGG
jgi:hypothetical protein